MNNKDAVHTINYKNTLYSIGDKVKFGCAEYTIEGFSYVEPMGSWMVELDGWDHGDQLKHWIFDLIKIDTPNNKDALMTSFTNFILLNRQELGQWHFVTRKDFEDWEKVKPLLSKQTKPSDK